MSHAVSDPHHHHLDLRKPLLLKGERTAPLSVRAGWEACSHAASCCRGPGGTTRLSSIQDTCTTGSGKSSDAVIRCQHTLSTSALEMVSAKPSPAPREVLLQQLAFLAPFLPSQMASPALLLEKPFHLTLLSRLCCEAKKQLINPAPFLWDSPDRRDLCYSPSFQG